MAKNEKTLSASNETTDAARSEVAGTANKLVQFVCQSKGGVGKSVLTYLLAVKYPEADILDMDDATKTTMRQLAFRDPQHVSFLNQYNTIDRGMFNDFIENVAEADENHIICDLGASVSEQLPYYFRDVNAASVATLLEEVHLSLALICVVGGSDIFSSTMNYLQELVTSVGNAFPITVAVNGYYKLLDAQVTSLDAFVTAHGLKVIHFNVSKDGNASSQARIKEVLDSGEGVAAAPLFSRHFFNEAVQSLDL
jgi:hypothetical protein